MSKALVPLVLSLFLSAASASCMVEDMVGNWTFHMDKGGHEEYFNCYGITEFVSSFNVELLFPNKVVDMYGNEGTWTMIDTYAFEIVVHGRKYYAARYLKNQMLSCKKTNNGYSHNIMNRDWFCFYGEKNEPKTPFEQFYHLERPENKEDDHKMYKFDESLIKRINSDKNIMWYAKKYEQYEKMTVGQMKRRMGQKRNLMRHLKTKLAVANQELKNEADKLPENHDWRNVNGVNYISPVRQQGLCGSCYIFASVGMNEARLNIASGGTVNVTLSPQDVLECNLYDSGCDGGFEFLVGGKYAEEHGMVEEKCKPYKAMDRECEREERDKCKKYYFTGYEHVGGYFGVCTEEAMKLALFKHGPITVAIDASSEFYHYGGGIYHKTGLELNPYYPTNHAVLVVGYGVEESTNTKYWIVKNSWGDDWGEKGYFRIRRGTNEIGIETSAFQSFPIF